jgi:hypothetical protein
MAQVIVPTPAAREAEARRHEVDIERRRAHPGEPRRTVVADRPAPGHDRRGAHSYASERRR